MERNQSTYRPCKMYMLTGNCLNKSKCPLNHLAPKVSVHKKLSSLKASEPFSMDFHPSGNQKKVEKTENIITEKKREPETVKATQPTQPVQNMPAQPRQNQNIQGLLNNNNQIDIGKLDAQTQQELMKNYQMQQQYQLLLMQQMQNQKNQFQPNNFGMNPQQNMMNQLAGMNMNQLGSMNMNQQLGGMNNMNQFGGMNMQQFGFWCFQLSP